MVENFKLYLLEHLPDRFLTKNFTESDQEKVEKMLERIAIQTKYTLLEKRS